MQLVIDSFRLNLEMLNLFYLELSLDETSKSHKRVKSSMMSHKILVILDFTLHHHVKCKTTESNNHQIAINLQLLSSYYGS